MKRQQSWLRCWRRSHEARAQRRCNTACCFDGAARRSSEYMFCCESKIGGWLIASVQSQLQLLQRRVQPQLQLLQHRAGAGL